MADDDVTKWTKRAVAWATNMRAAEEAAKAKGRVAKTAARRPSTGPKPAPPKGVRVVLEPTPEVVPGEDWAAMQRAQAMLKPPSTDAHHTSEATPCYVCGGPVKRRAAVYFGPWRRHQGCGRLVGSEAARVQAAAQRLALGELSWPDAVLVSSECRVPSYADGHREPTWGTERQRDRMPWAHVDVKGLRAAVAALPSLRADVGLVPTECTDGACAWCGVVESAGWWADGHVWPDGSPAPLCGSCHAVFVRNGSPDPAWWEGQRDGLGEALTGVPPMMGERAPAGVRGFAETVAVGTVSEPGSSDTNVSVAGEQTSPNGKDSEPGKAAELRVSGSSEAENAASGTPWAHLNPDAVRNYRFTTWARFGLAHCPPEHRDEVTEWARDRDRVWAAKRAEELAEEAVRANVHGF